MFGVEVNRTVGRFDQTFYTVTKVYGLSRAELYSDTENPFFSFFFLWGQAVVHGVPPGAM